MGRTAKSYHEQGQLPAPPPQPREVNLALAGCKIVKLVILSPGAFYRDEESQLLGLHTLTGEMLRRTSSVRLSMTPVIEFFRRLLGFAYPSILPENLLMPFLSRTLATPALL
jgi:hypothetical protein